MNFPQMLFQHIHYAPPEMQAKFCTGINRWITIEKDVLVKRMIIKKNEEWEIISKQEQEVPKRTLAGRIITEEVLVENKEYWKCDIEECTFNGLLIKKNKVFVINIYTFSEVLDYQPHYLDVTKIFKELLAVYNIYHACLILQAAIKNYYKDSTLTENLIPYIRHDRPYRLPKFRYPITRHHNRHKKFIDSGKKGRSERAWYQIIHRAIERFEVCESTANHGRQRPSLFIDYSSRPKLSQVHHKSKSKPDVREQKERKARRRAYAFTPKSGRGNSGSNNDL